MTNQTLALSYLRKASDRLDVLDLLLKKGAYSDVVREAQECVELALKAMLPYGGVEPPRIHDVGALLLEHKEKFSENIQVHFEKIAEISKWLRKVKRTCILWRCRLYFLQKIIQSKMQSKRLQTLSLL